MLTLAWPWILVLLPLPWLLRRALRPLPLTGEAALRVPAGLGLPAVAPGGALPRGGVMLALLWFAWALLLLAAARPQWLGEPLGLPVSGRDILLAVDLSGSMAERDFRTRDGWADRLTATKAVAGDFIDGRVGDRIGLVLFAEQAYLQAPLTFDRATARQLLDEAFLGLAGRQTAIGDAIGLGVRTLAETRVDPAGESVLVLLTDGVNNAGALDPLQGAGVARELGVRIYTIGIGSEGSAVPDVPGMPPRRGADLDEPQLIRIAETTGGRYFRARDAMELDEIYEELDRLEPVATPEEGLRAMHELFPWPLTAAALAFAALLLGGQNAGRWRRRVAHV
jgi:Ca-activated chloride channel homolog